MVFSERHFFIGNCSNLSFMFLQVFNSEIIHWRMIRNLFDSLKEIITSISQLPRVLSLKHLLCNILCCLPKYSVFCHLPSPLSKSRCSWSSGLRIQSVSIFIFYTFIVYLFLNNCWFEINFIHSCLLRLLIRTSIHNSLLLHLI